MKYIIVTDGVTSGVDEGVISNSIETILKCCGIEVTSINIDPYINIEAGIMSPYEQGEVYVLDDGGKVDSDLGNCEHFLDITSSRGDNDITTGKIYKAIMTNEGSGADYLEKPVQAVPHLSYEVEKWIDRVANVDPVPETGKIPEVCTIELGGTVGDIENMTFVEAFGQFQFRVKQTNFCVTNVSLVPKQVSAISHLWTLFCEDPWTRNIKKSKSRFRRHVHGDILKSTKGMLARYDICKERSDEGITTINAADVPQNEVMKRSKRKRDPRKIKAFALEAAEKSIVGDKATVEEAPEKESTDHPAFEPSEVVGSHNGPETIISPGLDSDHEEDVEIYTVHGRVILASDFDTLCPKEPAFSTDFYVSDGILDAYFALLCKKYEETCRPTTVFPVESIHVNFPERSEALKNGVEYFLRHKIGDEKDLVIFPMVENRHWTILLVMQKTKTLVLLDSLFENQPPVRKMRFIFELYATYALVVGKPFDLREWNFVIPKHDLQQDNGYDCGVFCCLYVEMVLSQDDCEQQAEDIKAYRRRILQELRQQAKPLGTDLDICVDSEVNLIEPLPQAPIVNLAVNVETPEWKGNNIRLLLKSLIKFCRRDGPKSKVE